MGAGLLGYQRHPYLKGVHVLIYRGVLTYRKCGNALDTIPISEVFACTQRMPAQQTTHSDLQTVLSLVVLPKKFIVHCVT